MGGHSTVDGSRARLNIALGGLYVDVGEILRDNLWRLGWVILFDLNGENRMFEGDSWRLEAGIEARQAEKRRLLALLSS